jgi:hypothetical protein
MVATVVRGVIMTESKKKIDQRRGGFYWGTKDGKKFPYVSVTQTINVISKPQLQYWFGKQVYWATIQDPTISEKEALSAPYQTTARAATRGSTIHSIVESYKHTKEHIETVPEEYRGYAQAFYNWVNDNDIEIIEHERTVFSREYEFAGTLDLLVKNKQSEKTFIIDVKTGKGIYPEAFLQLSAYKQALKEEGQEVDHIAVLLLKEDGKYEFGQGEERLDVFLAAVKLWEFKNPDLMEIVNVYKKAEKPKEAI